MSTRPTPTQQRLHELFSYDPDTGLFTRKLATSRQAVGTVLRPKSPDRYFAISADGQNYPAHRLVWKYVTGNEPNFVDHIDGTRSNNRIANLRDVTPTQNAWNRSRRTSLASTFPGVIRAAGGLKWKAVVHCHEGTVFVGPFLTPDAASAARDQLLLLYRGEHHRM